MSLGTKGFKYPFAQIYETDLKITDGLVLKGHDASIIIMNKNLLCMSGSLKVQQDFGTAARILNQNLEMSEPQCFTVNSVFCVTCHSLKQKQKQQWVYDNQGDNLSQPFLVKSDIGNYNCI